MLVPAFVSLVVFMIGSGWATGKVLDAVQFPYVGTRSYLNPLQRILSFPVDAGLSLTGIVPFLAWLVALAAIAGSAVIQRRTRDRDATSKGAIAPLVIAGPWTLFVLFLPSELSGESIAVRVASALAAVLLWVAPLRPPRSDRERRLIWPTRAIVALAAIVSLAWAHVRFTQFERVMKPMDRVLALIPRDARVATLVYDPVPHGIVELPTYVHLGGYILAARGGMASFNFNIVPYQPKMRGVALVRQIWWPSHDGWVMPYELALFYDYIFVKKGGPYPGHPLGKAGRPFARLIFSDGEFELWQSLAK
jgi:hypothetical protein